MNVAALATVVDLVDGTGTTLIVWTTTAMLLDDFGTVMLEYTGVLVGFDTSFTSTVEAGIVTGVVFAATGQIVVYRTLVSVITEPIFAGQFVTVSGQAVIV